MRPSYDKEPGRRNDILSFPPVCLACHWSLGSNFAHYAAYDRVKIDHRKCKEFKAPRRVMAKTSPFLEKLLNIDIKESKEGVGRLEIFSESVM